MSNASDEKEKKAKDFGHMPKILIGLWGFVLFIFACIALFIFSISQGWFGELPPVSDLENMHQGYLQVIINYLEHGAMHQRIVLW